ncbi:MoaD/ThiS family protein [Melissospora conviva]|uniref:MoaD/ThiS family protein n=1 Tax=Melissospora conviva TaxID=3388432 RepID=UPI003B78316D
MPVIVRYYAGARAAAGRTEETLAVGAAERPPADAGTVPAADGQELLPAGCGLDDLIAVLSRRHGPKLAAVLTVASFLVDGTTWHDRHTPLPGGATVDVLPPFAGG